jgi:hypothetical protein
VTGLRTGISRPFHHPKRANITKSIEKLRLMLEEQQTSLSVTDEPTLIASSERFLTEPLKPSASSTA